MNKDKIDGLLLEIRELERWVAGIRGAEEYPVSFFGRSFDLAHKLLKDLHTLETAQLERLSRQVETLEASVVETLEASVAEVPEPPVAEASGKGIPAERPGLFLNDLLEKKNLSDFRKAFSLNDRFRFRRELFGGDERRMEKAISDLNDLHSYEESVAYLSRELKWNIEDEAVADFIKLLEKRFR